MSVMTAPPRIAQTKAETALAALFAAEKKRLPGGKDFAQRREAAFALFEAAGLPHRRIEEWKYTDLRNLVRTVAPLAGEADASALASLAKNDPLASYDRARLVIANGIYRPDLSDLAGLEGVAVEPLADLLAAAPDRIGKLLPDGLDPVIALNTALVQGGVVVRVARGAKPARPIEIVHVTASISAASVYHRALVDVGSEAEVRFVESHRGPEASTHQVNGVIELTIGDGARVVWTRLQAEGRETQHLSSFGVRVGRDVKFDHLAVNTGASLARWQGFVTVAGTGAEIGFYGAGMLSGRQHGDIKLEVSHAVPHGRSRELYKSVVDGEADGAFQGRIVVKPDAQKTDAKMMTQALLLSDAAQFASKPELEIFADDVQCGHGATAGQIDETMLFYLLSRGVPRAEAERLLIEAFLADPIDAIGDEALGDALKSTIATWLASRGRSLEAS